MQDRPRLKYQVLFVLAVIIVVGAGCQDFPRDPCSTLVYVVERGTLRVGVVESKPWVSRSATGEPDGVESRLIAGFADEWGVEVEWHWGSSASLFEALQRYDLDIVIGGFSQANPWKKHVALSLPYYTSHEIVGVPPTMPVPDDLDGITVAVHPGSGLREALEDRGAVVVVREDLSSVAGPVAAAAWEIRQMGYRATEVRLRKHRHVIAVPSGENALLMHVEDYLLREAGKAQVEQVLEEAARP